MLTGCVIGVAFARKTSRVVGALATHTPRSPLVRCIRRAAVRRAAAAVRSRLEAAQPHAADRRPPLLPKQHVYGRRAGGLAAECRCLGVHRLHRKGRPGAVRRGRRALRSPPRGGMSQRDGRGRGVRHHRRLHARRRPQRHPHAAPLQRTGQFPRQQRPGTAGAQLRMAHRRDDTHCVCGRWCRGVPSAQGKKGANATSFATRLPAPTHPSARVGAA